MGNIESSVFGPAASWLYCGSCTATYTLSLPTYKERVSVVTFPQRSFALPGPDAWHDPISDEGGFYCALAALEDENCYRQPQSASQPQSATFWPKHLSINYQDTGRIWWYLLISDFESLVLFSCKCSTTCNQRDSCFILECLVQYIYVCCHLLLCSYRCKNTPLLDMWSLHTDCEIWLKNWRHENSKWSTSTPVIDFEDRDWSSVSRMIGQDTGPVLFVLQVRYQHGVHFWWMRQTVEGRNILFCFQRLYQCRLRCDSPMIRWLEKYN